MNKAGLRTAYYYLTSTDSVPKQCNIGNSWNSFLSFTIITQHKLYKLATSGICKWMSYRPNFILTFVFCVKRPSLKYLVHLFTFSKAYICPGPHITNLNIADPLQFQQSHQSGPCAVSQDPPACAHSGSSRTERALPV